jgi:hypothetical protein
MIAQKYAKVKFSLKNVVNTTGKTLNRLKTYLSSFWDYYQTSPVLQKALANA